MPPARFLPGTKSPGTPSDYSDAQWKAIEALKHSDPPLRLGAAKQRYVNHVLRADGSISADLDPVRAAAATIPLTESGNLTELEAHLAQERFLIIVDADQVPRIYFQCFTGLANGKPKNPDLELARRRSSAKKGGR